MQVAEVAIQVFGPRVELVRQYAEILATIGVERGLIGPREVDRIWERHILNCVVVQELIPEGVRVVDVGSGAGLPGIALALARPDLKLTLVEPLLRRVTFLEETVAQLGLPVAVYRGRAEELATRSAVGSADVVVSRAVAPLGKLMGWCLPLTRVGGTVLALKGRSVQDEINRDTAAIVRCGGSEIVIRECGGLLLDQATTVVQAVHVAGTRRR